MTDTLFLFPTEGEASAFVALRPDAVVRIAGVGMAEAGAATALALAELKPRRVVLCGIAGACDGRLRAGEVVEIVSDCIPALPAAYSKEYAVGRSTALPAARAFTVNRTGEVSALGIGAGVLCCGSQGSGVRSCGGDAAAGGAAAGLPAVEEMEGAAVAAVCMAFGVEMTHIRSVSNRVGDPRSEWRVAEAAEALGRAAAELLP